MLQSYKNSFSCFLTVKITFSMNLKIETSQFPDSWKVARVTPIFSRRTTTSEDYERMRSCAILPWHDMITEQWRPERKKLRAVIGN